MATTDSSAWSRLPPPESETIWAYHHVPSPLKLALQLSPSLTESTTIPVTVKADAGIAMTTQPTASPPPSSPMFVAVTCTDAGAPPVTVAGVRLNDQLRVAAKAETGTSIPTRIAKAAKAVTTRSYASGGRSGAGGSGRPTRMDRLMPAEERREAAGPRAARPGRPARAGAHRPPFRSR